MSNDKVPVYLFSINGELPAEALEEVYDALIDAFERADVDGEMVLVNGEVESIPKGELKELLK
jgi:hypothetical protein